MRRTRRGPATLLLAGVLLLAGLAAGGAAAGPTASSAVPAYTTAVFRGLGGEPDLAVSPDGRTVLVAGLGGQPANLVRSTDAGRSWRPLKPRFAKTGSADFDLAWLDDRTVVATDLSIAGDGILVHRSTDRGSTWSTTSINGDLYDRPWVAAHGQTVYVVARGFNNVPYLYVSRDGGRTFPTTGVVIGTELHGTEAADAVGFVTQQLVVAPDGSVYVLMQHASSLHVLRLLPGEPARFTTHKVADADTENGFSWMTTDSAGTVYVLAHQVRDGVLGSWLYVSRDRGRTWSGGTNLTGGAPGGSAFGAIDGHRPGELSLVHLRGQRHVSALKQDWWAEVARVTRADTGTPRVAMARPLAKPVHTDGICSLGIACPPGQNRNLLDFISTAVARDGTIYAVVASDGPATGDTSEPRGKPVTGVVLRSTRTR